MSTRLATCGECRKRAASRRLEARSPEGAQMPGPDPKVGDRLEKLLQVEKFPPPADFAARARVSDPGIYEQAAADPEAWWATQARERLHWETPFSSVLDDSNPPFYTWFADGTINVSYNCLDRHVLAGHGDRVAFHWRGEEGEDRDLTYAELLDDVQRLANALKAQGVGKGDVVGIYLPMIPEVVVAMLACARIGAPHTVVFGGFAPTAVRERLEVSRAKALIIPDGSRRKGKFIPVKHQVDEVISDLPDLETVVVVRSTGAECVMRPGRDVWFDDLIASADPVCPAEPMEAEHPLFLLYSSGSTAKPKGILHTTGGYLTAVTTTTAMVFDTDTEHDVFWYVQTYFGRFGPRTYFAGDGARRDEDGYFWITGRVDDVINPSGHAAPDQPR